MDLKKQIQREIKFRGLRTDGKGWAHGDLIHGVGHKEGKIFILPITKFPPHDCDKLDGYEVIPETVGQFTGLKDKNGKEIYEGDIIRVLTQVNVQEEIFEPDEIIDQELIAEVYYNKFFASFELITIEEALYLKSWGFYNENNDLEIIGNIHENKELLK